MSVEKAYKLLAIQEKISNAQAKNLIDLGLVSVGGKKVVIARALINANSKFVVSKLKEPSIIYEDENLLAINKPEFLSSDEISKRYKNPLLNRLDKDTSGVLLLSKNDEFKNIAINEYKNLRVKKTYIAVVSGLIYEGINIDSPIVTIKTKSGAFSKISNSGKEALSIISPLSIIGKKSLIKVEIPTGRTHQIRVHLNSINHPIIGDDKYNGIKAKRLFLHAYETEILGIKLKAKLPSEFYEFGFDRID